LVLGFRTSTALAAAYGVAVTMTMTITTVLFYFVARERWAWSRPVALAIAGSFLAIDVVFLGANLLKIPHGGWFPLVIGAGIFTVLATWKRGRQILGKRLRESAPDRASFLESLLAHPPHRVPGTAVFMYGSAQQAPPALLHNLKHNKVLHERVVFLIVRTEEVPTVSTEERVTVTALDGGMWQVDLRYGFMEDVNIPEALATIRQEGLAFKPMETTYFLGRETLIASGHPGMALWRERLFALMSRNAQTATAFFRLPPNRVVELGAQVEI